MDDSQGLFVIGTDTGVGKTLITCAIIRILRSQAIDAVGFKPVATGEVNGSWGDAVALHEASGKLEPIEKICPLRFALPMAPTLAARAEGIDPDLNLARSALGGLCTRHPAVIIEGVGGLLVPLDSRTLVADFALHVGFPVLLVCRAGLGTINHTLLTLREISRYNLRLAGIVMNITQPTDTGMASGAREEIERISGKKISAIIPCLSAHDHDDHASSPRVARTIAELDRQVDVRKLLNPRLPPAGRSGERVAVL